MWVLSTRSFGQCNELPGLARLKQKIFGGRTLMRSFYVSIKTCPNSKIFYDVLYDRDLVFEDPAKFSVAFYKSGYVRVFQSTFLLSSMSAVCMYFPPSSVLLPQPNVHYCHFPPLQASVFISACHFTCCYNCCFQTIVPNYSLITDEASFSWKNC